MQTPTTIHNVEQRLKNRTVYDEITGCWLHQSIDMHRGGHARIRFNHNDVDVHRISAHLYLGYDFFDETIQVNHKPICPNANCWNPEHLYIGTQKENVADSMNSGAHIGARNNLKTHCNYGHLIDGLNSHGKRFCKTCAKIADDKAHIRFTNG